ncbi:hypothetical protein [Rufibacter roseus]|uniref:Uncharacterized protein n=1 Tax=Rufibacter roseus TaxID=1567108 RepID=A0ABW2DKA9_9BACT|nr:hypothetical protein [Rufibacter roseus]
MVLANCRAQFTAADFDFVARVLARKGVRHISMVELLSDPECRDEMLDNLSVSHALFSGEGRLEVSQQLYFYVVARTVLRRQGIEDRELADYIGALLTKFSETQKLHSPHDKLPHQFSYIADMLDSLATASTAESFLIRAHIGNYALFLSGMFHAWVERRQQRGAPDFSFYEDIGRTSFRRAAQDKIAYQLDLAQVYHQLADVFRHARLALNELAQKVWNPDTEPPLAM